MLTKNQIIEINQAMNLPSKSEWLESGFDVPDLCAPSQKIIELHLLKQVAACSGLKLSDEQANQTMIAAIRSELRQIEDQLFTLGQQLKHLGRERKALLDRLEAYRNNV